MRANARPTRYGALAQALHWITAVLVLAAFIYGPGGSEERVYSAARDADRQLHETLGLSVLTLAAIRLAGRALDGHRGHRGPGDALRAAVRGAAHGHLGRLARGPPRDAARRRRDRAL